MILKDMLVLLIKNILVILLLIFIHIPATYADDKWTESELAKIRDDLSQAASVFDVSIVYLMMRLDRTTQNISQQLQVPLEGDVIVDPIKKNINFIVTVEKKALNFTPECNSLRINLRNNFFGTDNGQELATKAAILFERAFQHKGRGLPSEPKSIGHFAADNSDFTVVKGNQTCQANILE